MRKYRCQGCIKIPKNGLIDSREQTAAAAGSLILKSRIDIGRYTLFFFLSAALRQTKMKHNEKLI